jgi:hypothetical protein
LFGELQRVRQQVEQDLAQSGDVSDHGFGGVLAPHVRQVDGTRAVQRGGRQIERGLQARPEVERRPLEIQLTRLDLGKVEDVVDDSEE